MPVLGLLWLFYLSLTVVGQLFLSFQWDALLLETGLLAVFYAPSGWLPSRSRERQPSTLMRWMLWLLLFKLMFLSGMTKLLSGDPTWRHLTALDFHFETQPLPPWTAWYGHHWSPRVHVLMTIGMYAAELCAPWLILVPMRLRRLRLVAFTLLVVSQLGIAVTGNYGFFNLLTVVLCIPLLDDDVLCRVLPLRILAGEPEPKAKRVATWIFAPVVLLFSALAFLREIAATVPRTEGPPAVAVVTDALLGPIEPVRSVNGYGLFRVMTRERPEIVIEGSRDSVNWSEYEFRWKPGDLTRRPRFVAPYHPRLDWQMWFAALDPRENAYWLSALAGRLLEGSPDVLQLLGRNPFPERPPRYVRLVYYRYSFSTRAERARTGAWWSRAIVGYLTPALSLPVR